MEVDISKIKSHRQKSSGTKSESSALDFLNKDIQLFPKKLGDKKKERFYLELGTLLSAGVDIRTGLELISEEKNKKKEVEFFNDIKNKVIGGATLSLALKESGMVTPYEYHSLEIGEETGKIIDSLAELAAYFGKKIKQRRQLMSALTYPVIVVVFSLLAVFFLMKFIVPMFADIFKQFGGELPSITKFVVSVSNGIGDYYLYFIGFIIGLFVFTKVFKKKLWYRKFSSALLLRIPLAGGMTRKVYLARFSQSMSLLIRAKVPMLRAIGLVKNMIHFYPIQTALDQIEKDIVNGVPLHESMAKFPIFYRKMISLIKVGEEVNKLDEFFDRVAEQYNEEIDHKSSVLSNLLEPFIIIFLGLLVAVILISMYLPMFNLGETLN